MQFSTATVTAFLLSVASTSAFTPASTAGYVASRVSSGAAPTVSFVAPHVSGCACAGCLAAGRFRTIRFADATAASEVSASSAAPAEVPAEVEALDGIASDEEAHNSDRPARKSLKKKGPKGKPLSEFKVGDSVKARVKALASYGAFLDFGATTDGLLHISQLAVGYVADVKDILTVGQEVDVRITNIDEKKNQVGLSLLSLAQEDEAKAAAAAPRPQRKDRPQRQVQRTDDSPVLKALMEKGWDSEKFVEGRVVSTVDFGAFVKINAADLNPEVEGEFDGLVHISALTSGRVSSVGSVVKVDDKVQVRVKDIADRKVSLSMVSIQDEQAKVDASGSKNESGPGNANWQDDMKKLQQTMPGFKNGPVVVDLRK